MGDLLFNTSVEKLSLVGVLAIFAVALLVQQIRLTVTSIMTAKQKKKDNESEDKEKEIVTPSPPKPDLFTKEIQDKIIEFIDVREMIVKSGQLLEEIVRRLAVLEKNQDKIFDSANSQRDRLSKLEGREQARFKN